MATPINTIYAKIIRQFSVDSSELTSETSQKQIIKGQWGFATGGGAQGNGELIIRDPEGNFHYIEADVFSWLRDPVDSVDLLPDDDEIGCIRMVKAIPHRYYICVDKKTYSENGWIPIANFEDKVITDGGTLGTLSAVSATYTIIGDGKPVDFSDVANNGHGEPLRINPAWIDSWFQTTPFFYDIDTTADNIVFNAKTNDPLGQTIPTHFPIIGGGTAGALTAAMGLQQFLDSYSIIDDLNNTDESNMKLTLKFSKKSVDGTVSSPQVQEAIIGIVNNSRAGWMTPTMLSNLNTVYNRGGVFVGLISGEMVPSYSTPEAFVQAMLERENASQQKNPIEGQPWDEKIGIDATAFNKGDWAIIENVTDTGAKEEELDRFQATITTDGSGNKIWSYSGRIDLQEKPFTNELMGSIIGVSSDEGYIQAVNGTGWVNGWNTWTEKINKIGDKLNSYSSNHGYITYIDDSGKIAASSTIIHDALNSHITYVSAFLDGYIQPDNNTTLGYLMDQKLTIPGINPSDTTRYLLTVVANEPKQAVAEIALTPDTDNANAYQKYLTEYGKFNYITGITNFSQPTSDTAYALISYNYSIAQSTSYQNGKVDKDTYKAKLVNVLTHPSGEGILYYKNGINTITNPTDTDYLVLHANKSNYYWGQVEAPEPDLTNYYISLTHEGKTYGSDLSIVLSTSKPDNKLSDLFVTKETAGRLIAGSNNNNHTYLFYI